MSKRTRANEAAARVAKGVAAGQAGFTLVELLVVMVILGMLAALVMPNFFGQAEKARVKTTRVQMANLVTALDAFALDTGRYPSTSEGLAALVDGPQGLNTWDGPYVKKIPMDAWGNKFDYDGEGGDFELKSYGADGKAGGDDKGADLSSKD